MYLCGSSELRVGNKETEVPATLDNFIIQEGIFDPETRRESLVVWVSTQVGTLDG